MGSDPRDGLWPAVETGAALTAFLDLDDILRRAVSYLSEAVRHDDARIFLLDVEAHELVIAATSGPDDDQLRGRRFPDSAGVAGAVLQSGKACVMSPPGRHLLADADRAARDEVHSLVAPLIIGGRTLGVVQASRRTEGGAFGAADLERFVQCCDLVAAAIEHASSYRRLDHQTELLRRSRQELAQRLVAASPAMRRVLAEADRAAAGRSTILLVGETGTGKEQVARRIHNLSPRAEAPFVALNCGALPETLLESELFGHEKGAFTGADRRHLGRFELADGGTLFLDEIGELPAAAQVKLLRVLQEREISRLGGTRPIRVDVRLLAATHRDLAAEVRAGRFRDDLFFRIHVIPIHLPPLRERPEDIEPLTQLFLDRFARDLGRPPRPIARDAIERLRAHSWPGNVRELQNLIERLLVLGDETPIGIAELANLLPDTRADIARAQAESTTSARGESSLWAQERALLVQALERSGQNQTRAAQLLQISREQLRTRMKRYGLFRGR
jgi:transcriptional regulator with GAF, ATPase, and Fis domain